MKRFLRAFLSVALMATAANSMPTIEICESMPQQLQLATKLTTTEAWTRMLSEARSTVLIGQYYWSLSDGVQFPEYQGTQGAKIFELIRQLHSRGVRVRIVQNIPSASMPCNDTAVLAKEGAAEVLSIDFAKLGVSGIFHTKLMVVDSNVVYIGSANSDWRSLTQVKECGVVVRGEPRLAADATRVFEQAWMAARDGHLPAEWPEELEALSNVDSPVVFDATGMPGTRAYLAVSPPEFCTHTRTDAVASTVQTIRTAKTAVAIEVMDYIPRTLYLKPNYYWGVVDDALRDAAFRGVKVRVLVSLWNHTVSAMKQYMKSLAMLDNIEVRWFVVPDLAPPLAPVPYTRVNHAKFMVTESTAYISTSNWSADYFLTTHGVTFIAHQPALAKSLMEDIFNRDWNSQYARPVTAV